MMYKKAMLKKRDCRSLIKAFGITLVLSATTGLCGQVTSSEQAIELAHTILELQNDSMAQEELVAKAVLTNLSDSTTPFLSQFVETQSVWQVSLQRSNSIGEYAETDKSFPGDYEILFDPFDGKLLKITCRIKERDPEITPVILAEDAESQLTRAKEHYHRIPSKPPAIPLSQALRRCQYHPATVTEVLVQYVEWSMDYGKKENGDVIIKTTPKRDVWIITFIGTPPIIARGGSIDHIPIYKRNRMRFVINATTGNLIMSSTTPHVQQKP